ncbi:MAG TPA: HAMP domain-containing protein, partial [Solirubrobacterales bacterium]|nr:HAMP domain-containing protein [Solirubrobacterales bacterium]
MLTALAVIGVGHFIEQRQNYESSLERSYQREMTARAELAAGTDTRAARRTITAEEADRARLRDSISGDTRDTVILVGAGLLAGLIGALLLFAGMIAAMRRPLDRLVDAAGRLAAGDRSARAEVGGPAETAALGQAFN